MTTHLKRLWSALARTQRAPEKPGISQLRLLQEFLRRELVWATRLDMKVPRSAHEFYDLASAVWPTVLPEDDSILPATRLLGTVEGLCAIKAARWYWLLDNFPELLPWQDLPDPYEPLVWFFERGGRLAMEHGILDVPRVGGLMYDTFVRRLETESIGIPVVELNEQFLDQLDREGK